MKITVRKKSYAQVMALRRPEHRKPLRPSFLLRCLIRLLAIPDLLSARFRYTTERMELVGKKEPCLILMNHSSFIDMKAAYGIFFPAACPSSAPPTPSWA